LPTRASSRASGVCCEAIMRGQIDYCGTGARRVQFRDIKSCATGRCRWRGPGQWGLGPLMEANTQQVCAEESSADEVTNAPEYRAARHTQRSSCSRLSTTR
jgi:hypothetical protein